LRTQGAKESSCENRERQAQSLWPSGGFLGRQAEFNYLPAQARSNPSVVLSKATWYVKLYDFRHAGLLREALPFPPALTVERIAEP